MRDLRAYLGRRRLRRGRAWAIGLVAVLVAVFSTVLAPSWPARGEASKWDDFDVDVPNPVVEDGGVARLVLTSGCDNEIEVHYATRVAAQPEHPRSDAYDAQGPPATPGSDYRTVSGTVKLLQSRAAVLEVPLVNDGVAEGAEHVIVEFSWQEHLGAFAGDLYSCTNPGPGTHHQVAAFTIVDDDGPSATSGGTTGGGGASAGSGSRSDAVSAPRTPAGGHADTTPTSASSRASSSPGADHQVEELPAAEGIALAGDAAHRTFRVDRDDGSGSAPLLGGVGGSVGAIAFAAAVRRRRRRWS